MVYLVMGRAWVSWGRHSSWGLSLGRGWGLGKNGDAAHDTIGFIGFHEERKIGQDSEKPEWQQ